MHCSPILWNCISFQGRSATILDVVGKFERWRWRQKPSGHGSQWQRLWFSHPDGNFFFSYISLCSLQDSRPTWPTTGSVFLPAFLAKFSVQTLTKPSSKRQILYFSKHKCEWKFCQETILWARGGWPELQAWDPFAEVPSSVEGDTGE